MFSFQTIRSDLVIESIAIERLEGTDEIEHFPILKPVINLITSLARYQYILVAQFGQMLGDVALAGS